MQPLPEKNKLEIFKRKMRIEVLELRDLFIFFKCNVPFLLVHRRQCAHDRFPFCDGQTGTRQPGDASKQYLDNDHEYSNQQPNRNRSC